MFRDQGNDISNGNHCAPISENVSHLTAHITLWERYRYTSVPRATPQFNSGSPVDSTRLSETFPMNPNASMTQTHWQTLSKNVFHTSRWLNFCRRHVIVQNEKKNDIRHQTGGISWLVITPTNIQFYDNHIRAIRDFPKLFGMKRSKVSGSSTPIVLQASQHIGPGRHLSSLTSVVAELDGNWCSRVASLTPSRD